MKLKRDANGNVVTNGENPIYVHEDGQEREFDTAKVSAALTAANAEAKERREKLKEAEDKLKAFEGLDPAAARAALETVGKLDAKKLIDAGEVDRVKASIEASFTEKLTAAEKRAQAAEERYTGEKIGAAFLGSKFLTEKTILPPGIAQSHYAKNVRLDPETGAVVVLGQDGKPILSKANGGGLYAAFDEGLEILIQSDPQRDSILKGKNGSGSGAPSGGSGGAGAKMISRQEMEKMGQAERQAFFKDGGKLSPD